MTYTAAAYAARVGTFRVIPTRSPRGIGGFIVMTPYYLYSYHNTGDLPPVTEDNPWIYVFGSDITGLLRTQDQLTAGKYYNARSGVAFGQEATSFGIPVWDSNTTILPLSTITGNIKKARKYMEHRIYNANQRYWFTTVGVGPQGYDDVDIATLFKDLGRELPMPTLRNNISFPKDWRPYIEPVTLDEELHDMLFEPSDPGT